MNGNPFPNGPYVNRGTMILQAARGPVLLITIGVLFAIDQAGISFTRTWPMILIVLGVMKLLERIAGPPVVPPYTAPRYGAPPYAPPQPPPYGPPPPPPSGDPGARPGGRRQ
jgi:hypothetical protein